MDSSSNKLRSAEHLSYSNQSIWKSAYLSERINQRNEMISENVSQKTKTDYCYSDKAQKIMAKMGFDQMKGLGKNQQGIRVPVATSTQVGRRGLGFNFKSLHESTFDPIKENVQIREIPEWLNSQRNSLNQIFSSNLDSWMVEGHDETNFCHPSILQEVFTSKTVFDNMNAYELRRARTRSNPFETIRGSIFQNRAAVKIANMDACLDFMFTDPKDENGISLIKRGELYHFADICAGPGGFTEYVLWRKQWQAKGFGFTLRNEMDFKLDKFLGVKSETFDAYYGVNKDGNIYDPENIESLKQYVLSQTNDAGVHFMMADGGFSVEGQENLQEILSQQLYLCQCLVALCIVRVKGNFVVKLFDIFTPFSVGLVYLMYQCFEQVCILKPNSSRPANSERYLICKYKKAGTHVIERYLFDVNQRIWENKNSSHDIRSLVPLDVMKADKAFFQYICRSNNTIGENQILGLQKIAAFYKDRSLTEERRQAQIRLDSLRAWNLPLRNISEHFNFSCTQ